jgi:hypothetical protein
MKVSYTTKDGRLTAEFEVDTQVELFEELAAFQEIFENRVCTRNGQSSDNVVFRVRKDKEENKYYEMVCMDPNKELFLAKKAFNVHKTPKGYLYWEVKNKEGEFKKNNGWLRYNKDTQKEE